MNVSVPAAARSSGHCHPPAGNTVVRSAVSRDGFGKNKKAQALTHVLIKHGE